MKRQPIFNVSHAFARLGEGGALNFIMQSLKCPNNFQCFRRLLGDKRWGKFQRSLLSGEGEGCRVFPDGTKRKLKKIEPPMQVDREKIYILR
ncbi:MAG: hypothetical protein V4672_14830 [Verrucomicrobiota bacterium]